MLKTNPGFWDGSAGSAQVAKAVEAELLSMPSIIQSPQGQTPGCYLFKSASAQGILLPQNPQMITTIFNPDWQSRREPQRELFKCFLSA